MAQVRLILVGGFLGAGKTTLLSAAGRILTQRGKSVGLITNDQAPDLVDTRWLTRDGLEVREVSGSCFCCNFDGFTQAASVLAHNAQVILAEPVGSCTDLSATIVAPLQKFFSEQYTLAPLTVLCDPLTLRRVMSAQPGMHPSAVYIYKKQIEEAGVIMVAKCDLISHQDRAEIQTLIAGINPGAVVHFVSAYTGEGFETWLNEIMTVVQSSGHITPVDYRTYAEGEAVLGWLNAEYRLHGTSCCLPDWRHLAKEILRSIQTTLRFRRQAIGHIKILIDDGSGKLIGNLVDLDRAPELRGTIDPHAMEISLIMNARAELSPKALDELVNKTLTDLTGRCLRVEALGHRCLSPGEPNPTHRFAAF